MRMRVVLALLAGMVATAAFSEEKAGAKSEPATAAKTQAAPAAQAQPTPAAQAQPVALDIEKLSYALGMDIANNFKRQSVQLDPDALARGMKAVLSGGSTELTEQEARSLIMALRNEMRKKFETERAAAVEKAKVEGEKAKVAGEAFLAANKAKPGVTTLESGLQYEVLKQGTGSKPTLESTVLCNYRGTLVDGTEFDSSYGRPEPTSFPVKGVIKGWTEALQLMPVGSKWRIVVPAALAYGAQGQGPIPPNSTLIFELELVGIK